MRIKAYSIKLQLDEGIRVQFKKNLYGGGGKISAMENDK